MNESTREKDIDREETDIEIDSAMQSPETPGGHDLGSTMKESEASNADSSMADYQTDVIFEGSSSKGGPLTVQLGQDSDGNAASNGPSPMDQQSGGGTAANIQASFRTTKFRSPEVSAREVVKRSKLIGGKYTQREMVFVTTVGVLLSFNSGYINGTCLSGLLTPSGVRQSVSAFTGSYTNSALGLADGQFELFGRQIGMIFSFIFGATISGYMTPNAIPNRLEPTYGPTFLIGATFLIIASILAVFDLDDYLFFFAAAASGIQNGISSIYSANLIRSTHLTGTSTDIGIFLGQVLHGNRTNLWKLLFLIGLAASFWLGSMISFYATSYFTHHSLLFNAGLFTMIGGAFVFFIVMELKVSVEAAIRGTWMWGKIFDKLNFSDAISEQSAGDYFDRLEGTQDDGKLDIKEMVSLFQKSGIKITRYQAGVLFKAADKDGNGTIDRDEWIKIATTSSSMARKKSTHGSQH